MNYDFEQDIDRNGTYSLKWRGKEGELPMWVADMDFAAAPEIVAAIQRRAAHPIYGYTILPEEWYRAVIRWWQERHGFTLEKEWLLFAGGIVPAVSCIIRRLTAPGDHVLVLSPVYGAFFRSIEDNGRRAQESRMNYDKNGTYTIDYDDFEQKLRDPRTSLLLLSNPHNPTGNLWDRETLAKIGELCRANGVVVVADEIHGDLTAPGCPYTPFASVSEGCAQNCIMCAAPSKTFNLAGLQTSVVAIPDRALREKVAAALHNDGIGSPNAFAVDAAIAAFTKGGPWLDALCARLWENRELAREFFAAELPQVVPVPAQATYLLWLDCGKFADDSEHLARFIQKETGLLLSAGAEFRGDGNAFLRMNIACPEERLKDGLRRLKTAVGAYPGR